MHWGDTFGNWQHMKKKNLLDLFELTFFTKDLLQFFPPLFSLFYSVSLAVFYYSIRFLFACPTAVSESICVLSSVPLWDSPEWIHWKEHQEELPSHAPVHGEVPSNWCCGRTCQPQIRVKMHVFFCFHLGSAS